MLEVNRPVRVSAFERTSNRGSFKKNVYFKVNGAGLDWAGIIAYLAIRPSSTAMEGDDYGFFNPRVSTTQLPWTTLSASSGDGSGLLTLPQPGWLCININMNVRNFVPGLYEGAVALDKPPDRVTAFRFSLPVYEGIA